MSIMNRNLVDNIRKYHGIARCCNNTATGKMERKIIRHKLIEFVSGLQVGSKLSTLYACELSKQRRRILSISKEMERSRLLKF